MNNSEQNPNFELPPLGGGNDGAEVTSKESQPIRQEQYAAPKQPVLVPVDDSVHSQSQQLQPLNPIPATPASIATASPSMADDNDLIEKEWVIKAKQIVSATREDPYAQNREMSKFKADYLKKRYNKDIKIEEA